MRSRLNLGGPGAQSVERLPGASCQFSGAQYRPCAVREQHPQVAVAFLGNPAELATVAGRELLRRQTEPAGEVPGILEMGHAATGRRDHRRGGQ